MPRPGPRPYECIRRAWHSDSHQPLRGGLIQEIFRVVHELHSTSTRRKKEWQEKLPIVVLRAEEILYSKANCESEYLDVESLRNRLQDAVNTMIRREDSDESGPYLPPCVEAALSLGCPPRKTPRGHKQGCPRLPPRRSTPPSANPAMISAPATGKGNGRPYLGTIPEAVSSASLCPMVPQSLARQDQGHSSILITTAPRMFSPVTTPSSIVGTCHPSDANTMLLARSIFPSATEVNHSMFGPPFPDLRLSNSLTAADAKRPLGFQFPGNLDPLSQVLSNFHQDARAVPAASQVLPNFHKEAVALPCATQVVSNFQQAARSVHVVEPKTQSGTQGLLYFRPTASFCTSSAVSSPMSSISNMSQVVITDGSAESAQQTGQMHSCNAMPGMDSGRWSLESNNHLSVGGHLHFPPPVHAVGLDNSCTSVFPKSGPSSSCQQLSAAIEETTCSLMKQPLQGNHMTPTSADTAKTACSMDVHDLQLRLGPPQKEAMPSHTSIASEQPPPKFLQLTAEQPSGTSWNDLKSSPSSVGNNLTQTAACRNDGLNAHVCDNMPVIMVDTPASKRLRSDSSKSERFSPPCENMIHLGSGLAASMQFIWPRW